MNDFEKKKLETLTTSIDVGNDDQVYYACQFTRFLLNDDDWPKCFFSHALPLIFFFFCLNQIYESCMLV